MCIKHCSIRLTRPITLNHALSQSPACDPTTINLFRCGLDMEYTFARTAELQQLERKLASESEGLRNNVRSVHNPRLKRSLKRNIELLNWTLQTIELNPNITIQELEILVDCKIESLEWELGDAQTRWQTDSIFYEIRTLEWILFTVKTLHSSMDRFLW